MLDFESLDSRRNILALKFALKAEKHVKFNSWFKPAVKKVNTRLNIHKYCNVRANHTRFDKSSLSFLTRLLNC